ncbi:Dephospho-CoA kinase [uncultured archaeon]|nr:Dephospho-CoA kinase [uncultured archaeon]
MQTDGTINRKALGEIVFNDKKQLERLDKIMYTPMIVRLGRELYGKSGLILVNAALIAEADLGYLCNNNVVLIGVDKPSQKRRLEGRNLDSEQIQRRLGCQYSYSQKREYLENAIQRDKNGIIFEINNSDGTGLEKIENLFEQVTKELKVK